MSPNVLAELLKNQPVQILVLLLLSFGLLRVWKKQDSTSEDFVALNTVVTNIRDNHLEHLAQDISGLNTRVELFHDEAREDMKEVREGLSEINRFLRES